MNTRAFRFILLLVCQIIFLSPLSAISGISMDDDKTDYKPIVLSKESEVENEYRSLYINSVEAYLNSTSILLIFGNYIGSVRVVVSNMYTGESWDVIVDSNSSSEVVDICGATSGTYRIVILTEIGDCYCGTFIK